MCCPAASHSPRASCRPRLGSQVLVNMYNVQPFLEDCAFEPWEKRKEVRRPSSAVRWVTLA